MKTKQLITLVCLCLLPLVGIAQNDQKHSKEKQDLIELVSKQSCEEFEKITTAKISSDQFTEIVSRICSQHAEKTKKVYKMSFEKSAKKFVDDLSDHLFANCAIVKELMQK